MRTRFSIVKARTQDDQLQFNASKKHERRSRSRSRARREDRREDKYAGACSDKIYDDDVFIYYVSSLFAVIGNALG